MCDRKIDREEMITLRRMLVALWLYFPDRLSVSLMNIIINIWLHPIIIINKIDTINITEI